MLRNVALAFGIVFTAVGLLGFVLAPPDGLLLGIVAVNTAHNAVHLLVGLLGLAAAYGGFAKTYCQVIGLVYLLVGIVGIIPGVIDDRGMLLGTLHVNMAGNVIHLVAGAVAAYFGFMVTEEAAVRA